MDEDRERRIWRSCRRGRKIEGEIEELSLSLFQSLEEIFYLCTSSSAARLVPVSKRQHVGCFLLFQHNCLISIF